MLPIITLEEHYVSQAAKAHSDAFVSFPAAITQKLEVLGEGRIRDMDAGEVSVQVLSHGPMEAPPEVCAAANDELAAAVAAHPTRLAGFAMLPMAEPEAAAAELARCVGQLGFVGALLDNHLEEGSFYDGARFLPVFAQAAALDVPLYLHPTFASPDMMPHYRGAYGEDVALALSAFGWGWHADTGLHVLRLYASGLFDRLPTLKLVIGHTGELLPFQLARICAQSARWGGHARSFAQVWRENIWVTTSGMFALPPLQCLLQTTPIEHVLYSVDYPFSSNETGKKFLDEIRDTGLLQGDDLDKFAYKNAEALLKIKARP